MNTAVSPIDRDAGSDRLTPRDFARLAAFIREVTGIKMLQNKVQMLEGRLRRRVRATGTGSLAGYCDWFFSDGVRQDEAAHLVNAVTTNKTDFFREPRHFDYLRETILPALVAAGGRRIETWSAGCSTGAEPYTMAMLLDDFAAQNPGFEYRIAATDLDTEVLELARRGIFDEAMMAPVPHALRQRYVMPARDRHRSEVRIVPALRAAIGFGQLNLIDPRYELGVPMDVIFCRNVLIYFDRPTQETVIRRLIECLHPGGYLFLGHSESIAGFDLPLTTVANTVFKRT